ncbi:hypothetical protein Tco_1090918 [Tanacetum coccineum]|uniref:Uncharacterized protein n=1 Tax=Tanacetum coccineum TaxID=301880 RepID=A0ABQ5I6X8_9ASTR
MLERGSYIPWTSRFRRYLNRKRENRKWLNKAIDEGPYELKNFTPDDSQTPRLETEDDLTGDNLKHYEAEIEAMNLILIYIPNDIYNSVDACTTAQAMWQRVERLMRGTVQNKVDRETRFNNEFDQFVAEPGEALVSVYNRFAQLMNALERNGIKFPPVTVNTKLIEDSYDDLFDYLSQYEKLVNASRAKKLEKSHDPLALVAHTGSSSRIPSPNYVTHPSSVVDYDDDYQGDAFQNNSEDPLISAMMLLDRAITQRFSNPTNNCLRTSSNTRNQAIMQADKVNIQSRNSVDAGNTQRTLRTTSLRTAANMLLAKQDEAGVTLTDEHNDFLVADATRMEEIKELSANICLMARIQPTNIDSDAGLSYDYAFLSDRVDVNSDRINANKVKQQNKVLTQQLELYKEKVRVFEMTKGDNATFLNEFIEVDSKARRLERDLQTQFICDQDIIRDLEQKRDNLQLSVVELKRQIVELQKTQTILKRKMSENEDKYHDTVLDLEAKAKENENVVLKIGRSFQAMFMLGLKPMSLYDLNLKHGLGYQNPYTLKKAISQNPKIYDASCFGNTKIHVHVRDTEDILDDATKSQKKMDNKFKDPIAIEKKQNVRTIDYNKLNALYEDFVPQKELWKP